MKVSVLLIVLLFHQAASFVPLLYKHVSESSRTTLYEYIPDGMTPEQWKKFKQQEKDSEAKKKYGAFGPQSFKSRSMQAFQQDLEKGKASHLLPVFNAKEKMKAGKLKKEEIPYMQRGGAWDDSDIGKGKKKQWTSADRKYQANEAPPTPDWLGTVQRKGPQQKPGKTTNFEKAKPSKKLFGLF